MRRWYRHVGFFAALGGEVSLFPYTCERGLVKGFCDRVRRGVLQCTFCADGRLCALRFLCCLKTGADARIVLPALMTFSSVGRKVV